MYSDHGFVVEVTTYLVETLALDVSIVLYIDSNGGNSVVFENNDLISCVRWSPGVVWTPEPL